MIDEAHCITLSGHDYRPAYLSLQRLKVLFPKVPILCVTATGTFPFALDHSPYTHVKIHPSSFECHFRHDQDARSTQEDVSWSRSCSRFDHSLHVRFTFPSIAGAPVPILTLPFPCSAPLYRPNLNWSVVPKPQKAEQANQAIISYILNNHEGETGIIYCLSRADSENIAKEINANPKCKGKLKAAVCTFSSSLFLSPNIEEF